MKKINVLFLIFAMLLSANVFAEENTPDALRSAQVFAGMNIDSCTGWIGFNRVEEDVSSWINGDLEIFKEDGRFYIGYLAFSGVVIVDVSKGDDPLYGIPENAVGEARDYNINISCSEEGDDYNWVAHGYFYTPVLEKGEPIIITLEPDSVLEVIEYSAPGVDPDDLYLRDGNGNRYQYSSYYGGFGVWMNPATILNYCIMDYDGNTYECDTIDPLDEPGSGSGDSMMNVNLPEGVKEVIFDEDSYYWADNQELNGVVYADDTVIPAVAYYMDMEEKSGYISVYDITDVDVVVMAWSAKGDMLVINVNDNCGGDDNFCANIPNGYNKIVVLVTGGEVQKNGYYISFSKWSW